MAKTTEEKPTIASVANLDDKQLARLISARKGDSQKLNSETAGRYKKNLKIYTSNPEWNGRNRKKSSKINNNRIFDSIESVMSFLLVQMSKPNVIPASTKDESKEIANVLQEVMTQKNNEKHVKQARKRAVRNGLLSRLFCLKVYWDKTAEGGRGDWGVKEIDPRTIYIDSKASTEREANSIIEEITERLSCVVGRFPAKKKQIIKMARLDGMSDDELLITDPEVTYNEAWLENGKWVCFEMNGEILDKMKNPYWDWDGIPFSSEAEGRLKETYGVRREAILSEKYDEETSDTQYLFNHFSEPRAPYIFSTIFDTIASPTGTTDYIEQTISLAEDIDLSKRAIVDNAALVNGTTVVSESISGLSQTEARRIDWSDSQGVLWGTGDVINGVKRIVGQSLPPIAFENMQHSERQMTALEARILRQQSTMQKQELVELLEAMDQDLFNWEFQMMKCKYELPHLIRYVGGDKAGEVIEISREHIEDGMQVKVIPGSLIPEDRVYTAERAKEELGLGLINPVQYFEAQGDENAKEKAKQAFLFKLNPNMYLGITPEELGQMQPHMGAPTGVEGMSELPVTGGGQNAEGIGAEALASSAPEGVI